MSNPRRPERSARPERSRREGPVPCSAVEGPDPSVRPRRRIHDRLSRIGQVIRRIIGVPDYDCYLAHIQRFHPDMDPVSRTDFAREALSARYSRPGARCC